MIKKLIREKVQKKIKEAIIFYKLIFENLSFTFLTQLKLISYG